MPGLLALQKRIAFTHVEYGNRRPQSGQPRRKRTLQPSALLLYTNVIYLPSGRSKYHFQQEHFYEEDEIDSIYLEEPRAAAAVSEVGMKMRGLNRVVFQLSKRGLNASATLLYSKPSRPHMASFLHSRSRCSVVTSNRYPSSSRLLRCGLIRKCPLNDACNSRSNGITSQCGANEA